MEEGGDAAASVVSPLLQLLITDAEKRASAKPREMGAVGTEAWQALQAHYDSEMKAAQMTDLFKSDPERFKKMGLSLLLPILTQLTRQCGLLAWLARKPPTFVHHFPAIHGDSAQTKGTVLLSILSSSYPHGTSITLLTFGHRPPA